MLLFMKTTLNYSVITYLSCSYEYMMDNIPAYLLKLSSDFMSFLDLTSTSSSGRLVENNPLTSR